MDQLTPKTALVEDHKVQYWTSGNGERVLVFIHGWTCNSSLWQGQADLLMKHSVVVIDLPGHGLSDAPEIVYGLEYLARAASTVLEKEGIKTAVIVGHSMGGPVATTLLRLRPEVIAGVVYVDSFFHLPEHYLTQVDRTALTQAMGDDAGFEAKIGMFWSPRTSPDVQRRVKEAMLGTSKYVRTHSISAHELPRAWHWEEVYDIPALQIAAPLTAKIDQSWRHHLPRLEVEVWEANGHFLFMEDTQRFNEAVEAFLSKHKLLQS